MQQQTIVQGEYDALTMAHDIVDVATERKANDVTLIDLRAVTTLADYFVIATGTSARQIGAISRAIEDAMEERGLRLFTREGQPADGWILLDYGQIVVHVFGSEQRAYYDLERRWRDASTVLRIQ